MESEQTLQGSFSVCYFSYKLRSAGQAAPPGTARPGGLLVLLEAGRRRRSRGLRCPGRRLHEGLAGCCVANVKVRAHKAHKDTFRRQTVQGSFSIVSKPIVAGKL